MKAANRAEKKPVAERPDGSQKLFTRPPRAKKAKIAFCRKRVRVQIQQLQQDKPAQKEPSELQKHGGKAAASRTFLTECLRTQPTDDQAGR